MFIITIKPLPEMKLKLSIRIKAFIVCMVVIGCTKQLSAQTEFTTWGNLTGIRVENQLMPFETSLVLVNQWDDVRATRKEAQPITFERDNGQKIFAYTFNEEVSWEQRIQDIGANKTQLNIAFSTSIDTVITGAFFKVKLPQVFDEETQFTIDAPQAIQFADISKPLLNANYKAVTKSFTAKAINQTITVKSDTPVKTLMVKEDGQIALYFTLASGEVAAGTYKNTMTISVDGDIDREPVNIKIYPEQEGKHFDGIGGNFRLQNPDTDPQVIDYSLKNLRVAWSRVELPWRLWHENEDTDPVALFKKGKLHPKVKSSMEMAQRLDQMGIPVILAGWFAPDWAIIGERFRGKRPDGSMGNSLRQEKKEKIYASITSYVKFLKEEYGVEPVMFSFNESDLGIDVHQSESEHNQLIKELGNHFRENDINTQFLLGDTADANGWEFTTEASLDPEARPYIGGVSFHSWRGWTDENMLKWSDISSRVNKPLFVGEGSIDAGAWRYPKIFEEPTYALDEIDVYVKILNQAQPITILQWQLTADYSPMSGGGIFGNDKDELYPTQRFYNLKQLGETPKNVNHIPVTIDKSDVRVAAMGNSKTGDYAIHIVNKGATRAVTINSLPQNLTSLNVYVTNKNKSFEKQENIVVQNGAASFTIEGASYITLMN